MSERERKYHRDYYHNVRHPKIAANRAVDAATCEICGDEWANTQAGWNDAIFACNLCDTKLSNWDREKEMAKKEMEALCQVCYVEPSIGLHESSSLRCCVGCLVWLAEGEAEGSQRWKPAKDDPWNEEGGKLGHLFENGQGDVLYGEPDPASFADIPGIQALCGILSPPGPLKGDMKTPTALRRWGLCVACLQACPDPAGLAWKDRNYFAYVVPTSQEIAPAVGTS